MLHRCIRSVVLYHHRNRTVVAVVRQTLFISSSPCLTPPHYIIAMYMYSHAAYSPTESHIIFMLYYYISCRGEWREISEPEETLNKKSSQTIVVYITYI